MGLAENDFLTDVIRGKISGYKIMTALGERTSISNTTNGEDMWRGNELSVVPATLTSHVLIPTPAEAGEAMSFVSESTNDKAGGTGTQEITFDYLDINGLQQSVAVATDGTTVTSLGANITPKFINHMYTSAVGSGGVAAGNIRVGKTADMALIYNMIYIGTNHSLVPHRMVPARKKLALQGWHCAESANKQVAFRPRSTDHEGILLPGIFTFKDTELTKNSSSGTLLLHDIIPALSIVKITGFSNTVGGEGSCGWWGELIDN